MLEIDLSSKTIWGLTESPFRFDYFGRGLICLPVQSKFKFKGNLSKYYWVLPTRLHDCINCGFEHNPECCELFECNIKNNNGLKYREMPMQYVRLNFESFKEILEHTNNREQLQLFQKIWQSCLVDLTPEQNEQIKNIISVQLERINYGSEDE